MIIENRRLTKDKDYFAKFYILYFFLFLFIFLYIYKKKK
jgi:hypothetical protein